MKVGDHVIWYRVHWKNKPVAKVHGVVISVRPQFLRIQVADRKHTVRIENVEKVHAPDTTAVG